MERPIRIKIRSRNHCLFLNVSMFRNVSMFPVESMFPNVTMFPNVSMFLIESMFYNVVNQRLLSIKYFEISFTALSSHLVQPQNSKICWKPKKKTSSIIHGLRPDDLWMIHIKSSSLDGFSVDELNRWKFAAVPCRGQRCGFT